MKEKWGWSSSPDAERWSGGEDSREAAIEAAREEFGPAEPFYIMNGTTPDPGTYCPDVFDLIFDGLGERAANEAGEAADDWPDEVSREARAELQTFCEEWVRRHLPVSFWCADGKAERIDPVKPDSSEAQLNRKESR